MGFFHFNFLGTKNALLKLNRAFFNIEIANKLFSFFFVFS